MDRTWRKRLRSVVAALSVSNTAGWILTNSPHDSHSLRFHQVYASLDDNRIDSIKSTESIEAANAPREFPPPAGYRFSGGILVENEAGDVSGETKIDDTIEASYEAMMSSTAYGYLSNTLKLGDDAMTRITLTYPTVLGLSVENNVRPTLEWFATALQLPGDSVVEMVRRCPSLLQLSVHKGLPPKLAWFKETLGLSTEALGRVVLTCPALLTYATASLNAKMDFLSQATNLTQHDVGKLLAKHPGLLTASLEWKLEPTVSFLDRELGVRGAALGRALKTCPKLLSLSLEENLLPKAFFLKSSLGLSRDDCGKLMRLAPQTLMLSLEEKLAPLVAYLQDDQWDELGMTRAEVRQVLLRFPRLPSYSLDHMVRPRVAALKNLLGEGPSPATSSPFSSPSPSSSSIIRGFGRSTVKSSAATSRSLSKNLDRGSSDRSSASTTTSSSRSTLRKKTTATSGGRRLAAVLCKAPQILGVRLEEKIASLEALGWSQAQLRHIAWSMPVVLTYSVDSNLKPKIEFLQAISGLPCSEVLAACTQRPFVLGLSTEKRLKPRAAALAATLKAAAAGEEVVGGEFVAKEERFEPRKDLEPLSLETGSSSKEMIGEATAILESDFATKATDSNQPEDAACGQEETSVLPATLMLMEGMDILELTTGATKVPLRLFLEGAPLALEKFLLWLPSAPLRATAAAEEAAAEAAAAESGANLPLRRVRVTRAQKSTTAASSPNRHALKWEASFKKLEAFHEVNGHCNVGTRAIPFSLSTSSTHKKAERSQIGHVGSKNLAESESNLEKMSSSSGSNAGVPGALNKWVTRQRWLRRNGRLKPEREAALDGLNFE